LNYSTLIINAAAYTALKLLLFLVQAYSHKETRSAGLNAARVLFFANAVVWAMMIEFK